MPALFLIPPILFMGLYSYLNSTGPAGLILIIELPLILAYLERCNIRTVKVDVWGPFLRRTLYFLFILSFLIYIILIPESLYHAWLILLSADKQGGMISFVFVYAAGIVSSIGCASIILWKEKRQASLNLLVLTNMILLILYPVAFTFIPFVFFILLKLLFIQAVKGTLTRIINSSVILIPALLFAFLMPLKQEIPRGSVVIDRTSRKIQQVLSAVYPDLPLFLQVPGYGYSYKSVRQSGEKPLLTSNVIFTIKGESSRNLYLRSDVFYIYRDGNWLPVDLIRGEGIDFKPDLSDSSQVELTVETDFFTRIPLDFRTDYFQLGNIVYKVSDYKAILPPEDVPLIRNDKVYLYDSTSGNDMIKELTGTEKDQALAIPDDIRISLSGLSSQLTGMSDEESLNNIRSFLSEHYTYSLDTEGSSELILNFLYESKIGYCVHFSSSAALLARSLGIPVRIAEGFLVHSQTAEDILMGRSDGSRAVTGYSAHQWPEIFIEGRGWIPWEVTPPFTGPESLFSGSYDSLTLRQLESMGFPRESPDNGGTSFSINDSLLSSILLMITTVSAVLFIIFSVNLYRNRFSDKKIRKLIKCLIKKAEKRMGIASPERTGWIRWFSHFNDFQTVSNPERALNMILRYEYDKSELIQSEYRTLVLLLRELIRSCN